ncbi:MAG: STAS domain-containing protein [Candidatus Competibacter denitrificans]|jgi:anti-anti-sigma regulatory factor
MTLIECQPELDIALVSDLRQRLLDALQAGEPLEIEASAIRRAHTAALQVFLSAFVEARSLGISISWRNPSPALLEGARLLGLVDGLGLTDTDAA